MTSKQKRDIRLRVLRALLHPTSSVADMIESIPPRDVREVLDVVIETMISRLEFLVRARNARREMLKGKFAL